MKDPHPRSAHHQAGLSQTAPVPDQPSVGDGGVRASLLVTESLNVDDLADSSKTWADGIADADVLEWLQGA